MARGSPVRLRCSVDERRDLDVGAAGAPLGRHALGRGGRHGQAGLALAIEQVLESFSSTATARFVSSLAWCPRHIMAANRRLGGFP